MLKYFLAEGAACDHPLFLASRDIVPQSLVRVHIHHELIIYFFYPVLYFMSFV